MRPSDTDNQVALALSGGAVRCVAQIGVIDVLEESTIGIRGISATSAGSIVGALVASGRYGVEELKEIARSLRWRDVVKPHIPRAGLIDSGSIYRYVRGLLGDLTFQELKIPLVITACDLKTGETVLLRRGSVAHAVQASCSLPIIFTPTRMDDRILIDGGAVSQLPTLAARDLAGDAPVVSVDVNHNGRVTERLDNMLQIAVHFAALFARRSADLERPFADIQINVNAAGVPLYALEKRELLLRRGRAAAREKLPEIREHLAPAKDTSCRVR